MDNNNTPTNLKPSQEKRDSESLNSIDRRSSIEKKSSIDSKTSFDYVSMDNKAKNLIPIQSKENSAGK